MANRKRNIQMNFYVTENKKRLIDERIKLLSIRLSMYLMKEENLSFLLTLTKKAKNRRIK